MGKIGKNKSVISTSLDTELAELIKNRAKKLGISKGAYLRDLLVRWHERGASPVNDLDDLVQRHVADNKSPFIEAPQANDKNGKTA